MCPGVLKAVALPIGHTSPFLFSSESIRKPSLTVFVLYECCTAEQPEVSSFFSENRNGVKLIFVFDVGGRAFGMKPSFLIADFTTSTFSLVFGSALLRPAQIMSTMAFFFTIFSTTLLFSSATSLAFLLNSSAYCALTFLMFLVFSFLLAIAAFYSSALILKYSAQTPRTPSSSPPLMRIAVSLFAFQSVSSTTTATCFVNPFL